MNAAYFREQKRYSQQELQKKLNCSDNEIVSFVRKLKEYGVLKVVKATDVQLDMSDLIDEDVEVTEIYSGDTEYYYVFTFVGIIAAFGKIIKCFPKYINDNDSPKTELCQVIKVLQKYNSRHQIIKLFNETDETKSFNLLAVIVFLLQDYLENGSYNNYEDIVELNGEGEILWERTISESFSIISNNRPYYTELHTKKRVFDEYDYFKKLHECIVTRASKELEDAELLDIFEIPKVDISDEQLDDFGDREYILYKLQSEIGVQFNTRKQMILKTMYAYIAHSNHLLETDCISMYGTNSFNLVWESVCSSIMNNQRDATLGNINLPKPLDSKYSQTERFKDLIEKPLWSYTGHTAKDTLIPDLITTVENNGKYYFVIFDAKYYKPYLEPNDSPKAQPGIESVTKQYLYQLAYQEFIDIHQFDGVINAFLIPIARDSGVMEKGYVEIKFLHGLGLENIQVKFVLASMAYEYYLQDKKIDLVEMLGLSQK